MISNLTARALDFLNRGDPAMREGELGTLLNSLVDATNDRVKQVRIDATNAVALGLTDVGDVISILAFTTSGLAIASKALLDVTTDYAVAGGDVTPVGDHSAQTWVITYTPA